MTNYKLNIADALASLHPEGWLVKGEAYSGLEWSDDVPEKDRPTEAEINAELVRLQTEYDAQAYARNRKADYPDWGTQLNKIYDDGVTKWKSEMVDPIKAKWPKDNSGPVE